MPELTARYSMQDGKTVLCGIDTCGGILGESRTTHYWNPATKVHVYEATAVVLLEGYRIVGDHYEMHKRGRDRYQHGNAPTDARGRIVGAVSTGAESWRMEAGGESIPGGPQRERWMHHRMLVDAGARVKCLRVQCGFVSTIRLDKLSYAIDNQK